MSQIDQKLIAFFGFNETKEKKKVMKQWCRVNRIKS